MFNLRINAYSKKKVNTVLSQSQIKKQTKITGLK